MIDRDSATKVFTEFFDKTLALDPFLESQEHETLLNKYFHEFQTSLGIRNLLNVANLFTAHINSSTPVSVIENSELPDDINLTTLKKNYIRGYSRGWFNDIQSIVDKIVDPETRKPYLMPLLMHNFSKSFDVSSQMAQLVDDLRCSDGSKLKLDPESLKEISSELVEYLQRFEAPYQSANVRQMNLKQMFGILQTVEGLNRFGFAVKAPENRNACSHRDFYYTPQYVKIGTDSSLDSTPTLGNWFYGNILLSSEGIKKPYVINHEIFHMYLRMYSSDLKLDHIDDLKIFKPLLDLGGIVPISVLGTFYPNYIPTHALQNETIGALDALLVAATQNAGIAFNLSENCNAPLRAPGNLFKNFCSDGKPPRLQMVTPFDSTQNPQALKRNPTNTPNELFVTDFLKTFQVECYTAFARGLTDIIATYLELAKEKKEVLLSAVETASRIGFMTAYENMNSTMNIAIFSGLITWAKMMELGSKSLGIESPQESAQKLVAKISRTALGEEMTSRISNTNRTIPDSLKILMRQCLVVSFLYTIDAVIKNSQKKDDEIQTPGIGINIASGVVASIFSGLIGGGFKIVLTTIQSARGGRPEGAVPSDGVAIEISSPRPANTVSADLVHIMPAPIDNTMVNTPQPSPRQPSPDNTNTTQNNQNTI